MAAMILTDRKSDAMKKLDIIINMIIAPILIVITCIIGGDAFRVMIGIMLWLIYEFVKDIYYQIKMKL